jgi:hypothetical protein
MNLQAGASASSLIRGYRSVHHANSGPVPSVEVLAAIRLGPENWHRNVMGTQEIRIIYRCKVFG